MFSKTNRGTGQSSLSILAADCRLNGDITSDGEVHIDGRLEGDMVCKMLTVGETGVVTGKISADIVRILGSVNGQVKAQSVELGATARVVGDITHASLKVDAGAYVQGVFTRLPADTTTSGSEMALPAPGGMAAIAR
ncbi:MAG TPA: polymer-forming cytoskeletal protein [Magnetospirillaceae bacterium]|jgi:cytoskeletal protein CcmA (bactofilin family)